MTRIPSLIVIIEDDVVLNTLISATLMSAGYQTLSCTSEEEAERVIWTAVPDLVITDIRMQDIDSGWRIVQRMRQDEATRNIPVIVCSGAVKFLSDYREQLQQYGCVALEKHVVPARLLGMVNQMLDNTLEQAENRPSHLTQYS